MNAEEIINRIIYLPMKFKSLGNISIYSLLKETGYFEMYNQINEANIIEGLTKHPKCINQWLRWSEDKRTSSGWYFQQNRNGKYIVGYYPTKEDFQLTEYTDIYEACAVFIKREIEEIRKN